MRGESTARARAFVGEAMVRSVIGAVVLMVGCARAPSEAPAARASSVEAPASAPIVAPSVSASSATVASILASSSPPRVDAIPEARVESGTYGPLRVFFDAKRSVVTASYESSTGLAPDGKSPMFTCKFYVAARLVAGKRAQPAIAFDYFDDMARKAWVEVLDARRLRVHVEGDLSGSMAAGEAQDLKSPAGAVFERDPEGVAPEGELRHVVARTSHFFDHPGFARRKGYVVRGDDVIVLERKDGYVRVRFDASRGWIDEADLAPLP